MTFAKINGVTLPVKAESWQRTPNYVGGTAERAANGQPVSTRGLELDTHSFTTTPLTIANAEKFRLLLSGYGLCWNFTSTTAYRVSSTGCTPATAGSVSQITSGAPFAGNGLRIASGSNFCFQPKHRVGCKRSTGYLISTDGFTLICWRKWTTAEGAPSTAWYHTIIKGTTSFSRGVSANPSGVKQYRNGVQGSYNLGYCFSATTLASPFVGPHGYLNTNAASDVDIDDLVFLPFEIPDDWVAGIYAMHSVRAWPSMPLIDVDGDCVNNSAIKCFGEIKSIDEMMGLDPRQGMTASTIMKKITAELLESP